MSLLSRLRDKQASKIATATLATLATQAGGERRTVANVATVAVAKFSQVQTTSPAKIGASGMETASRWWLIHYPDRDPVKVACYPETTHTEMRKRYSNAVAAEPFTPVIQQPSAPLTDSEEKAIRAWLACINETDTVTIDEMIDRCQRDADARKFYLELTRDSSRGLFRQRGNDDNI